MIYFMIFSFLVVFAIAAYISFSIIALSKSFEIEHEETFKLAEIEIKTDKQK